MSEHNVLTDPELHEPKGAATASVGQVYNADGVGSGTWNYPEVPFANINTVESDAVTIGSIGTTIQTMPFSNNGGSNLLTADSANNRITLPFAGTYYVNFNTSFQTNASGDAGLYEFKVLDDGVETGLACERQMSGTSDAGSVTCAGIITVAANSQLTIGLESDDGGDSDDITLYTATLTAMLMEAS